MTPSRRQFLVGTVGLSALESLPFPARTESMTEDKAEELAAAQRRVKMHGDGPSMTALECAHELQRITVESEVQEDDYSRGGVVLELEERMATILGKERAVFMPTGTLANHLAVRSQVGGRTRVIVQADSHLYNDSGDCASVLSRLNLVPLAEGRSTFTVEEVDEVVQRSSSGKVAMGVGAISIESPVRRRSGELFDRQTMLAVCAYARENGIATHLDGARLFMAAGYSGETPASLAEPFDSVYVSMWKYFNAPSGAILAGSAQLLDSIHHERRMFGGGLPAAWPLAALALHSIDGFAERFAAGMRNAEAFFSAIAALPDLRVERIEGGSNVFELHVEDVDPGALRERLMVAGVELPKPTSEWRGFAIKVNETWARSSAEELSRKFAEALG